VEAADLLARSQMRDLDNQVAVYRSTGWRSRNLPITLDKALRD
jgi:hypothetical protein